MQFGDITYNRLEDVPENGLACRQTSGFGEVIRAVVS